MINSLLKKVSEDSVEFVVYLVPGAKKESVIGIVEDEKERQMLKVSVYARPENNSANKALIKFLAKHLAIPKSKISIKLGFTSRKKVIHIDGITLDDIKFLL